MSIKNFYFFILLSLSSSLTAQVDFSNTISTKQKIFGLSKIWQEANYNFAYFDQVPDLNWDSTYQDYISLVSQTANDYEYYRVLKRFIALLEDGHSNVYFPKRIDSTLAFGTFSDYSFKLKNIQGKSYIIDGDKETLKALGLGSEIVEINGKKTDDYLAESVSPYISSSTSYILENKSTSRMFWGQSGEVFEIKILNTRGEYNRFNLKLERKKRETNLKRSKFEFEWMSGKIAYIQLNSFTSDEVVSLFENELEKLHSAKGYIIDLRRNGGGKTGVGTNILKYFTDKDYVLGSTWKTRDHVAAYKAWGSPIPQIGWEGDEKYRKYLLGNSWIKGDQDTLFIEKDYNKLLAPLAVLIGNHTASAAEDFLIYLDDLGDRAKVFGQATFGSTGQPLLFDLPGGGYARICSKRDTYPDGRDFVGYGIQPDIKVTETIENILKKKDVTLEKAVEYLRTQISK
jgi:C-terminal processing protease CtpA/Prc